MTDPDVVVIGGGPSGCSAAVFTARYGLDTLVLDRGHSSLRQCAFVENYLGFPGGIDVDTLYEMIHDQVERCGGEVIADLATEVVTTPDGFEIHGQENDYSARRVVSASAYDVTYLEPVLGDHFESTDDEMWLDPDLAGERGETPVEGLWLAGPTAGVESQIAVAVGHGARVGVALIENYRREEEGIWDESATYTDWVVKQGRYEGEEWLEMAEGWHREDAPDDIDPKSAQEIARALAIQQQNQQISQESVASRTERGHRRLLDHLDNELILDYADELRDDPRGGQDSERRLS